jgi:hypothetical protein
MTRFLSGGRFDRATCLLLFSENLLLKSGEQADFHPPIAVAAIHANGAMVALIWRGIDLWALQMKRALLTPFVM